MTLCRHLWLAHIIILVCAVPSLASPTMIRLGYGDCAACHVSPQGGGLLTPYGKGIDAAQSLRIPASAQPADVQRRSVYDVRFVMTAHLVDSAAQTAPAASSTFRALLRSSLKLSEGMRMSYTAGLESATLSRTAPVSRAVRGVVSKALFEYRPRHGIEIAVGRDELPNGLGLPDPQAFMRNETNPGSTAYPTQVKAFWWNDRLQVTPYVFGPGGGEGRQYRQFGTGAVAGVNVWKKRAVVGVTGHLSHASAFERRSVGGFARLGFGRWGILSEHDFASRSMRQPTAPVARYRAGHTQVFFAPYEWLVTSLAAEDSVVEGRGVKHVYRVAPGAQVRVSDNLTVLFSTRDVLSGPGATSSRTYSLQVAVKTVQ